MSFGRSAAGPCPSRGAVRFRRPFRLHAGIMTAVTGRPPRRAGILDPYRQGAPRYDARKRTGGMAMVRTAVTDSEVGAGRGGVEPVIHVDALRKRYGKTTAVDGVSFSVFPGETFGLLGPNGAGKTTTMKIMCGLVQPDKGDVTVGGVSVRKAPRQVQRMLGVVPQGLALYEDLTAHQSLVYFAKLRGIARTEIAAQVGEILSLTGLADDAHRKVKGFSGGMKRRLNIGIGLLGRPHVLLLDEPTVGIDP